MCFLPLDACVELAGGCQYVGSTCRCVVVFPYCIALPSKDPKGLTRLYIKGSFNPLLTCSYVWDGDWKILNNT